MSTLPPELDVEMDANLAAFRELEPRLLQENTGKHAVMRHGEVIKIFDRVGEAVKYGINTFPDRLFSVHKIGRPPLRMGLRFADDHVSA
jgi:hypothetical protein